MDLKNQSVLVYGAGKSGIAAARLLLDVPAKKVILFDENTDLKEEDLRGKLPESGNLQIMLGTIAQELLDQLSLVILSPGVPTDQPLVETLRAHGVKIWGEIELAWVCGKGDVLAITGTNGKTTTTSLLGDIMMEYAAGTDRSVYVVGNIGAPYTEIAEEQSEESITVLELSSFQLETIESFTPKISAILNLTPDHMYRHHTMEEYTRVKEEIARNQTAEDTCVLNYDDSRLRAFGGEIAAKVIYFSSHHKLKEGLYLDGSNICWNDGRAVTVICTTQELKLMGRHNYENVMAAAAMAIAYHVPVPTITRAVCAFRAVEHRIEYVTEKRGVVYYNDSKGTNPDAAIKAIEAMDRPTLLIGGGYDKDASYTEWIRSFHGRVKVLVLIGQTKDKIARAAEACGFEPIVKKETLGEAVEYCAEHALPGDAVLLSPACASWDMFSDYEERGRQFKELVNQLQDE